MILHIVKLPYRFERNHIHGIEIPYILSDNLNMMVLPSGSILPTYNKIYKYKVIEKYSFGIIERYYLSLSELNSKNSKLKLFPVYMKTRDSENNISKLIILNGYNNFIKEVTLNDFEKLHPTKKYIRKMIIDNFNYDFDIHSKLKSLEYQQYDFMDALVNYDQVYLNRNIPNIIYELESTWDHCVRNEIFSIFDHVFYDHFLPYLNASSKSDIFTNKSIEQDHIIPNELLNQKVPNIVNHDFDVDNDSNIKKPYIIDNSFIYSVMMMDYVDQIESIPITDFKYRYNVKTDNIVSFENVDRFNDWSLKKENYLTKLNLLTSENLLKLISEKYDIDKLDTIEVYRNFKDELFISFIFLNNIITYYVDMVFVGLCSTSVTTLHDSTKPKLI